MKKILACSSIIIVILLVLISFNSVVTVQAAKTKLFSKSETSVTKSKISSLFQQVKKTSLRNLWSPGYWLAGLITLLSYIGNMIVNIFLLIAYVIYYLFIDPAVIPVIIEVIRELVPIIAAVVGDIGVVLLFYFIFFFAYLVGYEIHFPSPGPM